MTEAVVFVVDDDASMRESLKNLIGSVGLQVKSSPRLGSFYTAT
jgi:FixJ family two-component response regulator